MDSIQSPSCGQYWCKPCNKLFSSWDLLMKHKARRRQDEQDHFHCKICGQDFVTKVAERLHIQQQHPQEQDLSCPGCGQGPFKRLGALMAHFEGGDCINIDTEVLDAMREKKLDFARRLEELTQQSVKGNYMRCMPPVRTSTSVSGWTFDRKTTSFTLQKKDFPSLASTAGGRVKPSQDIAITESTSENIDENPNKENQDSLPAAKITPAVATSGVTTLITAMDPHDPTTPTFNSARYRCSITGKYNCPKYPCRKTFKTANGLVGHLKSPAHGDTTYRCPCCLKRFKSLTAITSHAESSGSKCRIQDTDNYEAFLDQLTAGIVDVERKKNDDGTLRYKTSDNARLRVKEFSEKESSNVINTKSLQPSEIKW